MLDDFVAEKIVAKPLRLPDRDLRHSLSMKA
jgi:hypothetical protein